MQAGILEAPTGTPDLTRAIMADQSISEEQKQALVRIYLSFRRDHEDERGEQGPGGPGDPAPAPRPTRADRAVPVSAEPAGPPPASPALERPSGRSPGRSDFPAAGRL